MKKEINLNPSAFNKAAKKLQKILVEKHSEQTINLSFCQETLSQALGFRNYNALQIFFSQEAQEVNPKCSNKKSIFELISFNQLNNLIENLIKTDREEGKLWALRSLNLFKAISHFIYFGEPSKNKYPITSSSFIDLLNFDQLYIVHKNELPSSKSKELLNDYLIHLPGFKINKEKQDDVVYEYHSYLTMNLIPAINILSNIESHVNNLIKKTWLYQEGNLVKIKPEIIKTQEYQTSWLNDDIYEPIIPYLINLNKNIDTLDLINLIITTTSLNLENRLIHLLKNLSRNHESFDKLEKTFDKLIK